MKTALIGLVVQLILLFVFLFNPTELNVGATFATLPPWALSIATILGNVTWLWGLLVFFVACIYTFATFYEGGRLLNNLVDEAIKQNKKTSKLMSTILLITSCIISIIGVGSGFWFVGISTLLANWSLMGYRTQYWKRKELGIFDDMEDAAIRTESESNALFGDFLEGKFRDITDDD